MVEHGQTLLVFCCRQLKLLREEGKLPKGGLEAGKLHGLTEADLKGPVLKIFKPSQSDVERLEYVPACCSSVQARHLMPCLEHGNGSGLCADAAVTCGRYGVVWT